MGEIGVLRADFHFPLEIRRNRSKSEEKTLFPIIFESFKDFRDSEGEARRVWLKKA